MSIATRLRLLVVLIVMTTALLIGGVVYLGYSSFNEQQRREALSQRAEVEAERLHEALASIRRDADMLAGLPLLESLNDDKDGNAEADKARLADVFVELLRTRKHYSQVRYLSVEEDGLELVRVDRVGSNFFRTPTHLLQTKSHRDYFQKAIAKQPGAVFLHSPSLNRERGVIQVPHRPVLRATANSRSSHGTTEGIIVIHLELQVLLDELYDVSAGECCHYIANQAGDYLYHPDSSKAFGFELGKRYLLQEEFLLLPHWLDATNDTEIFSEGSRNSLVDFQKVYLDPEGERFLILGVASNSDDTSTQAARTGSLAIGVTAALAALALSLAYVVAARTVSPVEQITRIAEQIANGGSSESLPTDRSDEVGTLARMFVQMLEKLEEKKNVVLAVNQQLSQANEDMEHFAQIASHDLREPARRVGTMADFLLTDELERLSPVGRETAVRLKDASARLLEQITDIRAITQVGEGHLLREAIELNEEVRNILIGLESELTKRHANSQIHDLPRVTVYASLVRILYAKLIDNALTHARQPGIRLEFSAEQLGSEWLFGVRNTGSSVPLEQQNRVFSPFTSLDSHSTRAGMGLSICKRIVERHSGRIWLESGADYVHVKFTLGEVHVT